jgi:dihydrofolate reductase
MNLIFASDLDNLIGVNGGLPWKQKADLARFKRLTSERHDGVSMPILVMGRKTRETLPKTGLPGRYLVTISGKFGDDYKCCNVNNQCMMGPKAAIEFLKDEIAFDNDKSIWVIGGTRVFDMLVPLVNTIYRTKIHSRHSFAINSAYWEVPLFQFKCVDQSNLFPADEDNEFPYQYEKYVRMT